AAPRGRRGGRARDRGPRPARVGARRSRRDRRPAPARAALRARRGAQGSPSGASPQGRGDGRARARWVARGRRPRSRPRPRATRGGDPPGDRGRAREPLPRGGRGDPRTPRGRGGVRPGRAAPRGRRGAVARGRRGAGGHVTVRGTVGPGASQVLVALAQTPPVGRGRTMTCEACGSALPPEAEFCPVCAAPAPERPEEHERPAAPEPETQADGVQVTPSAPAPAAAGTPDLEWASPWRRLGALVVDDVVIAIPAVALLLTWVPRVGEETVTLALVGVQLVGLATWVGMCVLEGRTGWTAGNLVWGLRTVHERSLEPPGVGRALVRRLVEAIGTAMCFFGRYLVAVSALWDDGPCLQGWQDRAASTSMLRVRGATAAVPRAGAAPGPGRATASPAPAVPADDVSGSPVPSEPALVTAPVPRETPAPAAPPVPVGDTPTPLIAEVPGFSRPTATTWEP